MPDFSDEMNQMIGDLAAFKRAHGQDKFEALLRRLGVERWSQLEDSQAGQVRAWCQADPANVITSIIDAQGIDPRDWWAKHNAALKEGKPGPTLPVNTNEEALQRADRTRRKFIEYLESK